MPGREAGAAETPEDLTRTLIVRLRAGDTQAGQRLDELYRSAMRRFCFGYLRQVDEAEDAVQDIFFKVLAAEQVPDNFRAWIYRIARHHCIDLVRRRRRHPVKDALPSSGALQAKLTSSLSRLVKREVRGRVDELLADLSPEQQEVLMLRYTEQLSRAEIAEVLDTSEPVVKSRLFEAVHRLRQGRPTDS